MTEARFLIGLLGQTASEGPGFYGGRALRSAQTAGQQARALSRQIHQKFHELSKDSWAGRGETDQV
jgi:hypothetical protein